MFAEDETEQAKSGFTDARFLDGFGEKSGQARRFSDFLQATHAKRTEEQDLFQAIRRADFAWASDNGAGEFQFEYFILGPKVNGPKNVLVFLRSLLQWDGKHGAWLFLDEANLPTGLFCHDRAMVARQSGWEKIDNHRFGFIVDASHPVEHTAPSAGVPGYVRFDFGSDLADLVKNEVPKVQWSSTTRTLQLRKSGGTVASIRFRSPNDEIRYGAALSELRIDASNKAIQCYRAFLGAPDPRLWLACGNGEALSARFDELTREAMDAEFRQKTPALRDGNRIGYRLWQELLPTWRDPAAGLAVGAPRDTVADLRALNLATLLNAERVLVKEPSPTQVDETVLSVMVAGSLERACQALEHYVPPDEALPDDPVMVTREIESIVGPWEFYTLYSVIARQLLDSPRLLKDHQYALLHALGICGAPATGVIQYDDLMRRDPIADAILRSHWQWPCSEQNIETCVKMLDEARAGSARETAAIESLARMDALPRVPEAVLNRWFMDKVVKDVAGRRRRLTVLSLQPTGREFLVRWVRSSRDDPSLTEARQATLAILKARANATVQTERYDFMAEEACQRLRELE